MKRLDLLLLGGLTTAVPAAKAAIYEVGTISETPYVQFVSYGAPAFHFTDFFNFTVPAANDVASSAQNQPLAFDVFNLLNISNLSMTLIDLDTLSPVATGAAANYVLSLGAGDYRWEIEGTTSGDFGGLYSFQIAIRPASLPVPASLLLLAGGAALLVGIRCTTRH